MKDIEDIPGTGIRLTDELVVGDVLPGREGVLEVIALEDYPELFRRVIRVKAVSGHDIGGEDIAGKKFFLPAELDRIWRVNE